MMISNKAINLVLLSLFCASFASAKFSFSRDQLRQFDFRRRHTTVGPSNAFRPAATVDTVTVTVSTTSTTTSTATTTSISTSETTASTTIIDAITTNDVPPAVVQMHTTHIDIIPRATNAVPERPRMRKVRRGGMPSGRDKGDDDDTLGDIPVVLPPSENIAAMKRVHRQRATHVVLNTVTATQPIVDKALVIGVGPTPVDALSRVQRVDKSATTITNDTASNITGGHVSVQDDLVSVEFDVANAVADVASSVTTVLSSIGSVGNPASTEDNTTDSSDTDSSTSSDLLSVGAPPIAKADLL